ncbi:hypothetical protein CHLNCDRAFT_135028 [Chlorella variabilis]|uniref:AB hydrolase-1 domain-containing protein n=1 Tax=Chlorella variabilis TaxID=554065 RepID=E1ZHE3_CHLVA|nr:hypothetical protein CHLNCDRAFT_135028 [Chlorella variabilis]EFN54904.1 hypothetical protein CHLNCDRAFT_135028 [Chlorella variabilis]|eukprot:XP_005847006.1 hypothetical protein CHLNCDRAFT_135028 [Chlorella variabilis]
MSAPQDDKATAATAAVAAPPRRGHEVVDGTGRRLSYLVYGQQDLQKAKAVLLFLHGVPASACEAATLDRAAAEAGMAVVSVDRPGVGESSPHTVHSLASFAVDLGSLLDALGLQGVALAGESGGRPYAAAAAALLGPTQVFPLPLVNAVGPLGGGLLDPLPQGEGQDALKFVGWRHAGVAMPVAPLVKHKPEVVIREAGNDMGPADRQVLESSPQMGQMMVEMVRGAYRQGVGAVLDEYDVLRLPWAGVDLGKIQCKTTVWHGTLDCCVPSSHGEWYAQAIQGSTLKLVEGEGHTTISVRRGREIIAAVLEGA